MDDSLNAEEREILEHFKRGTLRSVPDAEREMDAARRAARNTTDEETGDECQQWYEAGASGRDTR